jgi:hypothetical protein
MAEARWRRTETNLTYRRMVFEVRIFYREPTYATQRGRSQPDYRAVFTVDAKSEEEAKAGAVAKFKGMARLSNVNWVREVQRIECREVGGSCVLTTAGLPRLLDRLTPVDGRQRRRWLRMRSHLEHLDHVLWSASAGLDFGPAIEACDGGRAPAEVRQALQPAFLYVMSDYGEAPLARLLDLAKAGRPVKTQACTLDAGGSRVPVHGIVA